MARLWGRFLYWLGDVQERIVFSWDEWLLRARKPKRQPITQREILELQRQHRFERYITGSARAE